MGIKDKHYVSDDDYSSSSSDDDSRAEESLGNYGGSKNPRDRKEALPLRSGVLEGFEDGKYSGKVIRRKDAFGDESDDDSEQNMEDFHRLDQMENMEDSSEEEGEGSANEDELEIDRIRNKITNDEDLLNEGEIVGSIAEKRDQEIRKARHVHRQKLLWDNILRLRVTLQKPLDIANMLPTGQNTVASKDEQLGTQLRSTLYHMLTLQNSLLHAYTVGNATRNKALAEGVEEFDDSSLELLMDIKNNKEMDKNMDSIWNLVKHSYQRWKVLQERSINTWSRKTQLTGPSPLAGGDSSLKSINADATVQVKRQLTQMKKLVRDTQVWRGSGTLLGKRKRIEDTNSDVVYDVNVFDDRDFYQALLTNLLQEASAAGKLGGSGHTEESRPSKKPRKVKNLTGDRTLKYVTVPELVGFMAPHPKKVPQSSRALFNSLFGRRRCEDTINVFEYMSDDENEE